MAVSLAGCTAMDVISILQKKRQQVTGFEVRVQAERATDHPRVFTKMHVEYIVTGKGINETALERSIELSETKYCPAQALLAQAVEITHSHQIIETE
jgi:putative redox protein